MNFMTADREILFFFNRTIRSGAADFVFTFFSDKRSLLVLVPVFLTVVFLMKKYGKKEQINTLMRAVLLAAAAVAVSDLLTSRIIKPLFERLRPCQVIPDLYFWKAKSGIWVLTDGVRSFKSSFSFVSSHASNAMSAAAVLSYFYKRYSYIFAITALLIGISRMYLGVHYPSDVFAGWLTGILTGILVRELQIFLGKRYKPLRF